MEMLRKKQNGGENTVNATVSLSELEEMQKEVKSIRISDSINELMDAALLELRKKSIEVSDRTFFGFGDDSEYFVEDLEDEPIVTLISAVPTLSKTSYTRKIE